MVQLPIHAIGSNFRLERVPNLTRCSGKFDCRSSLIHIGNGESMRLEPRGHRDYVRIGWTIGGAKLGGSKPLVKAGRRWSVHAFDELLQLVFLLGGTFEQ